MFAHITATSPCSPGGIVVAVPATEACAHAFARSCSVAGATARQRGHLVRHVGIPLRWQVLLSRTVLIYGGAGGIGSCIARRLHARGDRPHLVGRRQAPLEALATELGATWTVGDVTDPSLAARASAEAGEVLHGLVYAIGTINLRPLARLTNDDFLHDFQVNAVGAALAVQGALAALRKGDGRASIVLFSSVAASQGFAMHASMGMAKAAVNGLALSLAAELAPGIRVNAIAPSLTATPLAQRLLGSEQVTTALAKSHPLERLGTPDDVAALADFLLSDQADWITGQIFGVDGGRSTLRVRN
ncbi:MAG: SDR family oxidoreductase [Gemmatimonadetes bacterium]|nr:SDR family oxidoreductase [Gemmatimonadota bacterium]